MKTHFLKYYQKVIHKKNINFSLENSLQQQLFGKIQATAQTKRSRFTTWCSILAAPAAMTVIVLGVYSYNMRFTKQVVTNTSFLQLVQTAYAQELSQEVSGKIHYQRYKAYLESDQVNNTTVESWDIQQDSLIRQASNVIGTVNILAHKTVSVTDTSTNNITVYSNEPATGKMEVTDEIDLCAGAVTANDPYVQIHSMIEVIKTESSTAAKKDILNKLAQSTQVEDLGENNGRHGLRVQEPVEVPVDCNESRAALFITEYYFDVQTLQLKKEISGLQGEAMSVMEYLEEDYIEPTAEHLTVFDTTGLQLEL